jgi:glyoxylase-like metal-dependent hydrolase (beta-lactamase superfamily II)
MLEIESIGEVTKFRMARTVFGKGLYFTAAYLVDGLMIDTGCAHTVAEFTAAIAGAPLELVVNTHSHEDHVAANAALHASHGAQIRAHPDAIPILAHPESVPLRPYQLVMWGRPPRSHALPLGETVETEHHKFQVIKTPGHSPDHVSLYEPDRGWLFCGDAYIGGQDRALRADYNVYLIIESLKTMAALDTTLLFPGSGTVKDNPKDELRRKIEYLEETGARINDLRRRGISRRRIRRLVFGSETAIAYFTLGHFSGRRLVRSFIEDAGSHTEGVE